MILMGDRGIPDDYRFMHGVSGHTFKLVNQAGDWVYARMHMKFDQGNKFITQKDPPPRALIIPIKISTRKSNVVNSHLGRFHSKP